MQSTKGDRLSEFVLIFKLLIAWAVHGLRFKIEIFHSSNFADKCGQLPMIQNVETETQFPVPYNTPVTVKCGSGYSLEGSDVITCIKEENYRSIDGQLPFCRQS